MRRIAGLVFAAISAGGVLAVPPAAHASGECLPYIPSAEQYYRMPRGLLYGISLVESGRNGLPHPWTLNVAGDPVYADSRAAITQKLHAGVRSAGYAIAVGCMQIYLRYHAQQFPSLDAVLDPELNVWYGAGYLYYLYRETGTWEQAVARYHASSHNPLAQREYICRVWKTVARTGGAADPRGASYCR
jgi:soluble lytic murein transglycosylase-like protein